jgi:hypothetical protein
MSNLLAKLNILTILLLGLSGFILSNIGCSPKQHPRNTQTKKNFETETQQLLTTAITNVRNPESLNAVRELRWQHLVERSELTKEELEKRIAILEATIFDGGFDLKEIMKADEDLTEEEKQLKQQIQEYNSLTQYAEKTDERLASTVTKRELFSVAETLNDVLNLLNRWKDKIETTQAWEQDPLVDTLPASLREKIYVDNAIKRLSADEYHIDKSHVDHDGWQLQQISWLANIADRVCESTSDSYEQAKLLFDWTVRNIQTRDLKLKTMDGELVDMPLEPWMAMIYGQGTAQQRAWVFMLLCRQQGIDAVMIGFKDESPSDGFREWLPAVILDNDLYLFDTEIGIPITKTGRIGDNAEIATLQEVVDNPDLLLKYNLSDEKKYRFQPEDIKSAKFIALVEGSPLYLSKRALTLQNYLSGKDKLILSANPVDIQHRLIPDLETSPLNPAGLIKEVRLWPKPYETLFHFDHEFARSLDGIRDLREIVDPFFMPYATLWNARTAAFKGNFTGDRSANEFLLQLIDFRNIAARSFDRDEVNDKGETIKNTSARHHSYEVKLLMEAESHAYYFLGMVAMERERWRDARSWFVRSQAHPTWKQNAFIQLAFIKLAQDSPKSAIEYFEQAGDYGSLLRAKWLKEDLAHQESKPE